MELENAAGYSVYHENVIGSGLEDRAQYKDSNFSTTGVYQHELWWTSGQYAGHLANCGLGGQRWYYGWKYQNYTAITDYTWERDSDWLSLDQADSSAESVTYRFRLKNCDAVSYTVTFKVVNGSWDDGTTADKTFTLEGIAADTLTLTEDQIPTAGTKPNANYKAGEWGVTPSASTPITADTTYTYTYALKNAISSTVTFKVVNGSWEDGTNADKTVTLNGYEGETLKLSSDQIPGVGTKPASNYKTGSWDTTPSVDTAIVGNKTVTYTYAAKNNITRTVTFKVVNGSWDDGTTADKTVTLTGYEGDSLKLTQSQIPAVGSKPNETYKVGSWDTAPNTTTAITSNKTRIQQDPVGICVVFAVRHYQRVILQLLHRDVIIIRKLMIRREHDHHRILQNRDEIHFVVFRRAHQRQIQIAAHQTAQHLSLTAFHNIEFHFRISLLIISDDLRQPC